MVHLTALTLSKCGVNVTDSGISAISKIPNIESLVLSRLINVTNTSLFDIANNCLNLRELDLSGCQAITSEGLRAFTDHPTLSRLFLYACRHISWGFFMFANFTHLECIGLSKHMKTPLAKKYHKYLDYGRNRCYIVWM